MRGSAITIPMLSNSYTKLEEEKKQLYWIYVKHWLK
jgi:hypothetical protein